MVIDLFSLAILHHVAEPMVLTNQNKNFLCFDDIYIYIFLLKKYNSIDF